MEIQEENVILKNSFNSLAYKYNLLINDYKDTMLKVVVKTDSLLPNVEILPDKNLIQLQHEVDINYLKKELLLDHKESILNLKTKFEDDKINAKTRFEEEILRSKYSEYSLIKQHENAVTELKKKYENEISELKQNHETTTISLRKEILQHVQFIRGKLNPNMNLILIKKNEIKKLTSFQNNHKLNR